jgi:hypothetical protein
MPDLPRSRAPLEEGLREHRWSGSSLGVILNASRQGADTVPYGFGKKAGDRAFGHGGARSSIAFADPDHAFTAAIFLTGRVPETEHQPRMRAILDLLRSELV